MTRLSTTSTMLVLQILLLASLTMTTTTAFAFAPSGSSSSSSTNSKSFLQRQPSSSLQLQRRRGLVVVSSTPTAATTTASTTETSSSVPPANARPIITKITSEAQLTAYLENSDDNRVTVLQFHAAWCKSCQKFGRLYHKLAVDHADWERIPSKLSRAANIAAAASADNNIPPEIVKHGAVRMASIEWGANAELCRSLGIQRLPTVHFYKGPLKLAGFAAGPSKIGMVKDTMEHYIDVTETELDFENEMKQGEQLVQDAIHMPAAKAATAETATTAASADASTAPPSKNLWDKIMNRK
jgi:thiol-disulfide isomerase/thioredoxin